MIHYYTLLQNTTAILLQNATKVYYRLFITKCNSYVLQIATIYYKMRRLLEMETIQSILRPNNVYAAT